MEAVRLAPDTSPGVSLLAEVPGWYEDAKCLDADPDVFFPDGQGASPAPAVEVCRACPVMDDCAAYALEHPELAGIWGATTDKHRRALRRERGAS